jgi:hypothetical protein
MNLFDAFMGAVDNPNQAASVEQLGSIVGTVQQLSGQHGIDPAMMQTVMSMVGGQLRSSLQAQQTTMGPDHVQNLLSQLSAGNTSAGNVGSSALESLLTPQMQQELAATISQKTGLDSSMILNLLPMLVPIVLQFLQGGAQGNFQTSTNNPLLSMFLDQDRDGDFDIGDAMNMAARFMQNQ